MAAPRISTLNGLVASSRPFASEDSSSPPTAIALGPVEERDELRAPGLLGRDLGQPVLDDPVLDVLRAQLSAHLEQVSHRQAPVIGDDRGVRLLERARRAPPRQPAWLLWACDLLSFGRRWRDRPCVSRTGASVAATCSTRPRRGPVRHLPWRARRRPRYSRSGRRFRSGPSSPVTGSRHGSRRGCLGRIAVSGGTIFVSTGSAPSTL